MKKILGLSIAALVIIGLVAGGTLAYFSDTETTGSNTFTAGIIDITVDEDSNTIWSGTVEDLKPCMTGYKIINITASSTSNPMELWKKINMDVANRFENTEEEPEIAYYIANGIPYTASDPSGSGKNDIDRYIHFDMWIESDPESTPQDVTFNESEGDIMIIPESDGWLLSENTDDNAGFTPTPISTDNGVAGKYIYLGRILNPGETMIIVQSFHMDASVGNWAQSDSISFTEEILAQQIEGSTLPPEPSPVLDNEGRPAGTVPYIRP